MKQLSNKSTIDKVHNAISNYMRRYYKFRFITDEPLAVMGKGDTLTSFAVEHCKQTPNGNYRLQTLFLRDVMHIRESGSYGGIVIDDLIVGSSYATTFNKLVDKHNFKHNTTVPHMKRMAHRDAIQLIPMKGWFSAGCLEDVTVSDMVISSTGELQPIFGSDGTFENLTIKDNKIHTNSQHKITISGMLSGSVENNTDVEGNVVSAVLHPLRLGGGKLNINVISFHMKSSKQYRVVTGDVTDTRTIPRKGKEFVELLHWDRFRELVESDKYMKMDRFIRIKQVLRIMNTEGTAIYTKK